MGVFGCGGGRDGRAALPVLGFLHNSSGPILFDSISSPQT